MGASQVISNKAPRILFEPANRVRLENGCHTSDDQYQSKHQQRKLLRAATIKVKVNVIHTEGRHEETKLIDDLISFPLVNLNRIIVPHYEALVLTLYINGFDVHRVLLDPGSVADLL